MTAEREHAWLISDDAIGRPTPGLCGLWRALVADWLAEHPPVLWVDVRAPREGEVDACDIPPAHVKRMVLAGAYADRALDGGAPEDGYGRVYD